VAAVCVFCASSTRIEQRWLDLAYDLGVALARRGHTLVSGGGRVGMMGTVAEGARSMGAYTLGVIPESLVFQEAADPASDELVTTADMAERKSVMMAKADAFVVLPGGLGTLDELFEVWTTGSLALHDKPVVLVNVDGFYAGLLDWVRGLVRPGFVQAGALASLIVVDSIGAALDAI
jgi:uncharacterized protein (TIGR00730 family)